MVAMYRSATQAPVRPAAFTNNGNSLKDTRYRMEPTKVRIRAAAASRVRRELLAVYRRPWTPVNADE